MYQERLDTLKGFLDYIPSGPLQISETLENLLQDFFKEFEDSKEKDNGVARSQSRLDNGLPMRAVWEPPLLLFTILTDS